MIDTHERLRPWLRLLATGAVVALLTGCSVFASERAAESGDIVEVEAGRQVITDYGCSSCHTIPGIKGADAHVGPPLTEWSKRIYIAGSLPNTRENLVTWITDPQSVEPGTAMPDLGVSEDEALQIAAYLQSLD